MSHSTISFLVLGGGVVLFVWGRIPVEIVALGAALSLYATGVLTLNQSLAGFADPAVLFIASLFVVSEGLDAAGVTAWAGTGRPLNPMINAGAIVTTSLLRTDSGPGFERILAGLSGFAGRRLDIDEATFESERETGDRNRALGYLMRAAGSRPAQLDDYRI